MGRKAPGNRPRLLVLLPGAEGTRDVQVLALRKSEGEADELVLAAFLTFAAGGFVNTPSMCFPEQHRVLWP